MVLYTYGGRAVPVWWDKHHHKLSRFDNLTVINLPQEATEALAELAQRSMHVQVTIQDGEVSISNQDDLVSITPQRRYPE